MVSSNPTTCCGPCKMHVETGTLLIAILGSLLNIGQAIWAFLPTSQSHQQNIVFGIGNSVLVLAYLSIIVAQQKRNHKFYLPYLILTGLSLIATVIIIFIYIGFLIAAPQWVVDSFNKDYPELEMDREKVRILLGIGLFVVTAYLLISGWFYSVIYRAYKFLKEESTHVPRGYPAV